MKFSACRSCEATPLWTLRSHEQMQNHTCWNTSYTVGLPNQRQLKVDFYELLCFWSLTVQLTSQRVWFCTIGSWKAPIALNASNVMYSGADPGEVKWVNFHPAFSEPPSFFLFFYPSNIEIIFDFSDIISKIHSPISKSWIRPWYCPIRTINKRIWLTCLFPFYHPIQITWWFIEDIAVLCNLSQTHNWLYGSMYKQNWIATSRMNHHMIWIG